MNIEDYPKAYVVASYLNPEFRERVVTVECPLCPRRHLHGAALGERGDLGYKIKHCPSPYNDWTEVRGYIIWDETPVAEWETQ